MLEDIDLSSIQDENARQLIGRLLNLVEALSADLRDTQAENQRLRDENDLSWLKTPIRQTNG